MMQNLLTAIIGIISQVSSFNDSEIIVTFGMFNFLLFGHHCQLFSLFHYLSMLIKLVSHKNGLIRFMLSQKLGWQLLIVPFW